MTDRIYIRDMAWQWTLPAVLEVPADFQARLVVRGWGRRFTPEFEVNQQHEISAVYNPDFIAWLNEQFGNDHRHGWSSEYETRFWVYPHKIHFDHNGKILHRQKFYFKTTADAELTLLTWKGIVFK